MTIDAVVSFLKYYILVLMILFVWTCLASWCSRTSAWLHRVAKINRIPTWFWWAALPVALLADLVVLSVFAGAALGGDLDDDD